MAYGWSASRGTFFGSPSVAFTVPYANRYLRDLVTLPASRGLGIYPRLLQKIVGAESGEAERFWILHEFSNQASARGIAKAGFRHVADILVLPSGGLELVGSGVRAALGAKLLGLPLVTP